MLSPAVVKEDMARVRRACKELDQIARVVGTSYEELYEASLQKAGAGEGTANRRGLPIGDPTGDTAISGVHRRMRWRCRQAARLLRRLLPILEEAENILLEGFMETDPEFREKLRRLRELERAAEAAQS